MFRHFVSSSMFALALLVCSPSLIMAQWLEGSVTISEAYGQQRAPRIVDVGGGEHVVVWIDGRLGGSHLHAAKVTADGTQPWPTEGALVSDVGADDFRVVDDSLGGVFVVWSAGTDSVLAQHLDSNGNRLWGSRGLSFSTGDFPVAPPLENLAAARDGSGGVYVFWFKITFTPTPGTFGVVQRLSAQGQELFASGGVTVKAFDGLFDAERRAPEAIADDAGGVILTWTELDVGVRAQRVDFLGNLQWEPDGVLLGQGNNVDVEIDVDGVGGLLATWSATSGGALRAQRVDAGGTRLWGTGGILCGSQTGGFDVLRDGTGGAFVVFGGDASIYAQRVTGLGQFHWLTGGRRIGPTTRSATAMSPSVVADGQGGLFFAWTEALEDGTTRLRMQRIDIDGNRLWETEGVLLVDGSTVLDSWMAPNDHGGVTVTWNGKRSGIGSSDLYALEVFPDGYSSAVPSELPVFTELVDVPNDQGGRVMLTWNPSELETATPSRVVRYSIWRRYDVLGRVPIDTGGSSLFKSGWERIGEVPVHALPSYSFAAHTLRDSVAGDPGYHKFIVSAETEDPAVFYNSAVDSCYSIDNLAPTALKSIAGAVAYDPPRLLLQWPPSDVEDVAFYRIYRSVTGGANSTPVPSHQPTSTGWELLGETSSSSYEDDQWAPEDARSYAVTVVDTHDNEGPAIEIGPQEVTGVGGTPRIAPVILAQNTPNPFNPSTTISWVLPRAQHARLEIFDTSGRLVVTLFDELKPSGPGSVEWNGTDATGNRVASGIYAYHLTADHFEGAKRMVLLK